MPVSASSIRLFLCGDVMTGRAIDQILRHPGSPVLHESYIRDARDYITLAEAYSGPIPRPVDDAYPWGEALTEWERAQPDVRIINLETSITTSDEHWPGKAVHYRMHPRNVGCLHAAQVDCCVLANNHVLDWGYAGLAETTATLTAARIPHAGAGQNAEAAAAPAILPLGEKGRILVFAYGSTTSGIPPDWGAASGHPGVNLLPDLSPRTAARMADDLARVRQPGDVVVASIHWGSNWGFEVSADQQDFAHALIDAGVSVVHGHSSHHVRPMERYGDGFILYGCGDFLTDYEGITGYEAFRGDLALMVLVDVEAGTGRVEGVRLVPFQVHRFRLRRASAEDTQWLHALLNRVCEGFGTTTLREPDGSLRVERNIPRSP